MSDKTRVSKRYNNLISTEIYPLFVSLPLTCTKKLFYYKDMNVYSLKQLCKSPI